MASLTVVEHLQSRATSCGYCHAGRDSDGEGDDDEEAGTSKSFGMLVPSLTPEQYEGLLERGWRRSGTYIYRPYNDATCCPQHPIRLKAMDFQASKDQRRLWRRFQQYLLSASSKPETAPSDQQPSRCNTQQQDASSEAGQLTEAVAVAVRHLISQAQLPQGAEAARIASAQAVTAKQRKHLPDSVRYTSAAALPLAAAAAKSNELTGCSPKHMADLLAGALNDRQAAEGRAWHVTADGPHLNFHTAAPTAEAMTLAGPASSPSMATAPCSLAQSSPPRPRTSQAISESLRDAAPSSHLHPDPAQPHSSGGHPAAAATARSRPGPPGSQHRHKKLQGAQAGASSPAPAEFPRLMEMRGCKVEFRVAEVPVPLSPEDFRQEYRLYDKYQRRVHGDKHTAASSFRRFLVDSPISRQAPVDGASQSPATGYGTFHQQYWLDGQLAAVGVVDVLPQYLSSVYLFWDPDLPHLALGKLSALWEIRWVQQAAALCPRLQYYCMGFYIHSCPKMRYKGGYKPSQLLCTRTLHWVPLQACLPALDEQPTVGLEEAAASTRQQELGTAGPASQHTGLCVDGAAEARNCCAQASEEQVQNVVVVLARYAHKVLLFGELQQMVRGGRAMLQSFQEELQRWKGLVGPLGDNMAVVL